jgi:uncharacterized membrane protein YfhO
MGSHHKHAYAKQAFNPNRLKIRFILIFSFLFLIYNPSGLSALDSLQSSAIPLTYRVSLAVTIFTLLTVLIRQTWTAMRLLGTLVVMLLMLSLASFIWYLRDWIELDAMTRYFASLAVYTFTLTFGQVLALGIQQLSGQKSVLKNPP